MNRVLALVLCASACSASDPAGDPASGKHAQKPEKVEGAGQAKAAEPVATEPKAPAEAPTQKAAEAPEQPAVDPGEPEPEAPTRTLACYEAAGDDPDAVCNPAYECGDKDLVAYEVQCAAEGDASMKCTCWIDGEAGEVFSIGHDRCDELLSLEGVAKHCKLDVRLVEGE